MKAEGAPDASSPPGPARLADPSPPDFLYEGKGGEPLLLLHDVGEGAAVWEPNLGALAAAGYEVIAPDLPSFRSSGARTELAGAWREETAWLDAWLRDGLGVERILALGGGLGGVVAQQLSLWQPGFVTRLVLWDCALPRIDGSAEAMGGQLARSATQLLPLPNPTPALLLCGEPRNAAGLEFEARAPDVFSDHLGPLRMPAPAGEFGRRAAPLFHHAVARLRSKRTAAEPGELRAFVALGSNLGPRELRLCGAIAQLRAEPGIREVSVSPVYETDPIGPGRQGAYLNAVASLQTTLEARALLARLQAIERDAGRRRGRERNAPRTLDLDLLFHGELCIAEPDLEVPHPRLHERAFVLEPLADLAAEVRHPRLGLEVAELALRVRDPAAVRRRR